MFQLLNFAFHIIIFLFYHCAYIDEARQEYQEQRQKNLQGLNNCLLSNTSMATEATNTSRILTIVATSHTLPTYCRLSDGMKVGAEEDWDISAQRFRMGTNSGVNSSIGNGRGGVCLSTTGNFSDIDGLPQSTESATEGECPDFIEDLTLQTNSVNGEDISYYGNTVFENWYSYDISIHFLKARDTIYILRSADGYSYYKLQFLDYYSEVGTPAYVKIRYSLLPPP